MLSIPARRCLYGTEFLYALDRNLEDVDYFYNKRNADAARRLHLLQARYGTSLADFQHLDANEAQELRDALMELRDEMRKLAWFGEVNRKGFLKITKKLDKKIPYASTQQQYLASKVDLTPFATNTVLEQHRTLVSDWLTSLGKLDLEDVETSSSSSTNALGRFSKRAPSVNLPATVLEDLDRTIKTNDGMALQQALLALQLQIEDASVQRLLTNLLQRAINCKSDNCFDLLLEHLESLKDLDDINERNCIHRLVIVIGRTKSPESSDEVETQVTGEIRYISLATAKPKPAKGLRKESPKLTLNDESVMLLDKLVSHLRPRQMGALSAKDNNGRLPLHYAAQYGLVVVCELLMKHMEGCGELNLQNGIDSAEWYDREGHAPLHLSVIGGHPLTTKTLLGANNSSKGQRSPKLSPKNPGTSALLALATRSDSTAIVQLLIDAGIDVDGQDESGETALHVAARYGLVECAKIILSGSRDPKALTNLPEYLFSWTPLHTACVDGHLNMVELLIDAGANARQLDNSGWNAQEHAALRGYLPITKRLAEVLSTTPAYHPVDFSKPLSNGGNSINAVRSPTGSHTPSKAAKPVKSYGHRYLTRESLVLVSLGSMNTSKDFPAVKLDRIPLAQAHATHLDTALSIVVSAKGAEGEASVIDLPVRDNICTEPIVFTTMEPSNVKLYFDIVPTYSGSKDQIYGRGIAVLSSVKPQIGHNRMSLQGDVSVPIISKATMEDIGQVNFNFLIITPFFHSNLNVAAQHTYWKQMTSTMVIGHRGLGKNVTSNRSLQLGENTIQSFIAAANLGANYVEFDVQLTKDHVPVIYHDFLVSETGIDAPVHTLTLEQFLHINQNHMSSSPLTSSSSPTNGPTGALRGMDRPRSMSQGFAGQNHESELSERMKHTKDFKAKGFKPNTRGHFIQAPFVTLEEMFRKLPEDVGFNIEFKYAMLFESEEQEMGPVAVELNSFVDAVLKVVYDLGHQRKIIFSSFNPDICLLLSFKQPNIPVMFLTDAGTLPVGDVRASSLQEAIRFATRWNLLGIVSEAEVLCACPRLVRIVKDSGLVCVSYGTSNNDPDNVQVRRRP